MATSEFKGDPMARPKIIKDSVIFTLRMEREMERKIKDIAALESVHSNRLVTMQELIRNAINFVYEDNERLRECFRRSRSRANKRFK